MVEELHIRNQREAWFVEICAKTAEGVPLGKLAEKLKVMKSVMRIWIASDPEREKLFKAAQQMAAEAQYEDVRQEVYNTAMTRVAKVDASAKLKAAEMVLSPKSGSGGSTSSAPATVTVVFVNASDGRPAL